MKEAQEVAEKARAIGWHVGLSPQKTTNQTGNYPKRMANVPSPVFSPRDHVEIQPAN